MMMSCRTSDNTNAVVKDKSFRIKHDDIKLFSRLLSRRSKNDNHSPSFRIYYADDDVSVPFVWETHPGTPKHRFSASDDSFLRPPLTPPPSFYSTTKNPSPHNPNKRSNLLKALLLKISLKRATSSSLPAPTPPPPSSSFSSSPSLSSSSSSSLSSFSDGRRRARRFSDSGFSFDKGIEDISTTAESSPTCFGIVINRQKVFSSIVGPRQS